MAQLNSTLTASDARANFYQILEEASGKWRQFTIKLRGKGDVVVMSADEAEGWNETFEILADTRLAKDVRKGIKELKAKKGVPLSKVWK